MAFFIFDEAQHCRIFTNFIDSEQQVFQEIVINSKNVNEYFKKKWKVILIYMKINIYIFDDLCYFCNVLKEKIQDLFLETLVMKQISFRDIDGYSITIYDSGLKVSILDEHLA